MKKLTNSILSAMMLVSLITMTGCGEKEIKPADYISITYSGVNGKGKASADFDVLRFADDLVANAPEKKQDDLTQDLLYMDLDELLTYEIDNKEGLGNGDTVTVTIDWDDTPIKKDYKLKFGGEETVSVTVEDLPDVIELDAFDPEIFNVDMDHKGVHISVTGISPHLQVKVQNDIDRNDPRSKLIYRTEYSSNYANGDEVIVSAGMSYELDEELYALKEETGSFTLQGYDEYLNDGDQLTDEVIDSLKKDCNDKITALLNGGRDYLFTDSGLYKIVYSAASSIEYSWDKAYLLTLKKGVSTENIYSGINQLFIPVEINAYDVESIYSYAGRSKDITGIATGILVSDIVVTEDGITISPDEFEIASNYVGVETAESLISIFVTSYADRYDIKEIDISSWNDPE